MKKFIIVFAIVLSAGATVLAFDKEKGRKARKEASKKEMKCTEKDMKECKKEGKSCCEKKAEQ